MSFLHSWLWKQNGCVTGPRAVNELGGPVIPVAGCDGRGPMTCKTANTHGACLSSQSLYAKGVFSF